MGGGEMTGGNKSRLTRRSCHRKTALSILYVRNSLYIGDMAHYGSGSQLFIKGVARSVFAVSSSSCSPPKEST